MQKYRELKRFVILSSQFFDNCLYALSSFDENTLYVKSNILPTNSKASRVLYSFA